MFHFCCDQKIPQLCLLANCWWPIGSKLRTRKFHRSNHLMWCHQQYGLLQGIIFAPSHGLGLYLGFRDILIGETYILTAKFVPLCRRNLSVQFFFACRLICYCYFRNMSNQYLRQSISYFDSVTNMLDNFFKFCWHISFLCSGWQLRRGHQHC